MELFYKVFKKLYKHHEVILFLISGFVFLMFNLIFFINF